MLPAAIPAAANTTMLYDATTKGRVVAVGQLITTEAALFLWAHVRTVKWGACL